MAGFRDLIEVFVSCTVDVAGNGAVHSGKGLMMAGARKIGWASGGSGSRQGRRFAGHSIAKRGLASGFGNGPRGRLGTYDPASEYRNNSGVKKSHGPQGNQPGHLFGRPGFDSGASPLGRSTGHRYVRNQQARPASWSKNPRGNINF